MKRLALSVCFLVCRVVVGIFVRVYSTFLLDCSLCFDVFVITFFQTFLSHYGTIYVE